MIGARICFYLSEREKEEIRTWVEKLQSEFPQGNFSPSKFCRNAVTKELHSMRIAAGKGIQCIPDKQEDRHEQTS